MSETKMDPIPRAAPDTAAALDDFVRGDEPAKPAPLTTIRAIVTPEQKRRLGHAAVDQGTSVSKIIRDLIDRWLAEQDSQ